ncbi:MAG: AAA family ATPase [Acidobacteriota bacterium]
MQLPAADIKPDTKRERVQAFLDLPDPPIHLPDQFSQACEASVFNVGMGFKVQGWRQLRALYDFVSEWTQKPGTVRDDASSNPWAFKRFVEHTGGARAMRNLLMYLAFPDTFEPIVSQKHKEDIRSTFLPEVGGSADSDVDRDLFRIRQHLEDRAGARISFYSDELMPQWRSTGATTAKPTPTPELAPAEPVSGAPRKAWLVRSSPRRGRDLVVEWLEQGVCSLPAADLPGMTPGMTREAIAKAVETAYTAESYNERNTKVNELHSFLTQMRVDDVVATTSREAMMLGRITGDARLTSEVNGEPAIVRPVDWARTGSPVDLSDLPALLQARLRVQQDVADLTRDVAQLASLLDLADTGDEREAEEAEDRAAVPLLVFPRVSDQLARELHLPRAWLQETVDILRQRRQIVLYGPPGTGKTHLAQRLARYLTGDPQNVKLVQFHPTYSYEDFFEGYRPTRSVEGTIGFELRPGPFRRLVDRARKDDSRTYVLIIDELNRANLATVFGELYFLLEYRDEAIDLVYSSDEYGFTMPENVFIVGTMNTADRSIALMDSAMRRRFAFVSLHPDDEPVNTLLEVWLRDKNLSSGAAALLSRLNQRVQELGLSIGPTYFMREDIYGNGDEGLRRVWRTSIIPLLEEQHLGVMTTLEVAEHYAFEGLLPDDAARGAVES